MIRAVPLPYGIRCPNVSCPKSDDPLSDQRTALMTVTSLLDAENRYAGDSAVAGTPLAVAYRNGIAARSGGRDPDCRPPSALRPSPPPRTDTAVECGPSQGRRAPEGTSLGKPGEDKKPTKKGGEKKSGRRHESGSNFTPILGCIV